MCRRNDLLLGGDSIPKDYAEQASNDVAGESGNITGQARDVAVPT